MAWIRSNKGVTVQSVKIYSGRVVMNNGTIVADSDYCYTDFIPFSNGYQMISVGESNTSAGSCWYKEDGTYGGNYWGASGLYMRVNNSPYYSNNNVRKQRITFKRSLLDKFLIFDEVLNVAYVVNYIKMEE